MGQNMDHENSKVYILCDRYYIGTPSQTRKKLRNNRTTAFNSKYPTLDNTTDLLTASKRNPQKQNTKCET
jgi:hypothetical protein